jgi:hypothetical protein
MPELDGTYLWGGIVSGIFAPDRCVPTVRPLQLAQLKVTLAWAVEVLRLPPRYQ